MARVAGPVTKTQKAPAYFRKALTGEEYRIRAAKERAAINRAPKYVDPKPFTPRFV